MSFRAEVPKHSVAKESQNQASALPAPRARRIDLLWQNLLIAIGYWLLAIAVKWYFSRYQMWPAPLWAPAGLALFAGIAMSRGIWPGIFIGSLITNTLTFREPLGLAVVVSSGNTIGPILGAWFLRDRIRLNALFGRVKDVYYFGVCAFLSGMISAAIALSALAASNPMPRRVLADKWFEWMFSDVAASLVLTPLFLLWRYQRPSVHQIRTRSGEFAISTALAILAVVYLLFGTSGERAADAGASFLILLPLLWISVRMSLNIAYPMFLAVMSATIAGSMAGHGPFFGVEHGGTLVIFAQMAIGFGAAVLLLGGAANEQRAAQHSLRKLNLELERRVELRTSALRASRKRLEKAALYDSLTGLSNRRLLEERFASLGKNGQRNSDRLALLLIDLDYFKEINDNFGHDAGDALLVETGCRLTTSVREDDTVARMGGDEFAVLLSKTGDREVIDAICQRILKSLHVPMSFHEHELQISSSIGVAIFPDQGSSWQELYKAADIALYAAKRGGRNAFRWSGAELQVP